MLFPDWLLTFLLTALLLWLTLRIGRKAVRLYKVSLVQHACRGCRWHCISAHLVLQSDSL